MPKHDEFEVLEICRANAQGGELQDPAKHPVTEREQHEASRSRDRFPHSTHRAPDGRFHVSPRLTSPRPGSINAPFTLAKVDERKSRVVELRFFGGLSVEETATVLTSPTRTRVERAATGTATHFYAGCGTLSLESVGVSAWTLHFCAVACSDVIRSVSLFTARP
jgi:hypothetical protein